MSNDTDSGGPGLRMSFSDTWIVGIYTAVLPV